MTTTTTTPPRLARSSRRLARQLLPVQSSRTRRLRLPRQCLQTGRARRQKSGVDFLLQSRDNRQRLTTSVHLGVLSETLLHGPELVDAIDALDFFLRVDKARERVSELLPARSVGHAAETRAFPIDFTCFGVERG